FVAVLSFLLRPCAFLFCLCFVLLVYLLSFFQIDLPFSASFTLSLHDALPICASRRKRATTISSSLSSSLRHLMAMKRSSLGSSRSEEHTSELQSRFDLVCRLLLEKKNEHEKYKT